MDGGDKHYQDTVNILSSRLHTSDTTTTRRVFGLGRWKGIDHVLKLMRMIVTTGEFELISKARVRTGIHSIFSAWNSLCDACTCPCVLGPNNG